MIEAINAARGRRGVAGLRADERLASAAYGHAADLSRHPGMMHVGSDGSDIDDRLRRAGYEANYYREVVGWGFDGDVGRMVDWWLNSPDHAPILMDAAAVDVGVGYVVAPGTPWGHYWTVDFAAGDSVRPAPAPGPYTSHLPVVVGAPTPAPAGVDLLAYLRGDGRAYRVGNGWGSFEVFQTQVEGDRFYQVKAWDDLSVVNWEEFVVAPEHIGRDVDTSPGGGRFYRQFGAAWVKRFMRVGESFAQGKRVQFYRLSDCAPLSGPATQKNLSTVPFRPHASWAAFTCAGCAIRSRAPATKCTGKSRSARPSRMGLPSKVTSPVRTKRAKSASSGRGMVEIVASAAG